MLIEIFKIVYLFYLGLYRYIDIIVIYTSFE